MNFLKNNFFSRTNKTYDGGDGDVQWIEMSGSQYSIDELDLVSWLKMYGEILTLITKKKSSI